MEINYDRTMNIARIIPHIKKNRTSNYHHFIVYRQISFNKATTFNSQDFFYLDYENSHFSQYIHALNMHFIKIQILYSVRYVKFQQMFNYLYITQRKMTYNNCALSQVYLQDGTLCHNSNFLITVFGITTDLVYERNKLFI